MSHAATNAENNYDYAGQDPLNGYDLSGKTQAGPGVGVGGGGGVESFVPGDPASAEGGGGDEDESDTGKSEEQKKKEKNARERYPNKSGQECHHVVPKYLNGPENGRTVKLPAAYHQLITNSFRKQLPYKGKYTQEQIDEAMGITYSELPITEYGPC